MAYDDIANNTMNPFPGKIFNKPSADGVEGDDVYEGCKIDYKGKSVTAENLIKVLQGDKSAGGPVLETTENSRVFFYFADHGAPGLVAMPSGPYLYADKLNETFINMHKNKQYKEMAVYIEACESGSMFANQLDDNLNIFAVTAANSMQSSWGTYCSPNDKVNGKSIKTCLGDLFSVNWLENTDACTSLDSETLQEQYDIVKKQTTKSQVCQFGTKTMGKEPLADYLTGVDGKKADWWTVMKQKGINTLAANAGQLSDSKDKFAVDSRDIKLQYLYNLAITDPSEQNYINLKKEIDHRMNIDKVMAELFPVHMDAMMNGTTPNPSDYECYRTLIDHYGETCGAFSDYSLKYLKLFAAECEAVKA